MLRGESFVFFWLFVCVFFPFFTGMSLPTHLTIWAAIVCSVGCHGVTVLTRRILKVSALQRLVGPNHCTEDAWQQLTTNLPLKWMATERRLCFWRCFPPTPPLPSLSVLLPHSLAAFLAGHPSFSFHLCHQTAFGPSRNLTVPHFCRKFTAEPYCV